MERTNQFNLQQEINHFIEKINANELLSSQEVAELKDHFLSQTEELERTGLSAQEAFTISKMRFGEPEMIQDEYEKSKPFEKWKNHLMLGAIFFMVFQICQTISFLSSLGIVYFLKNTTFIDNPYITYFYTGFQVFSVFILFIVLFKLIQKELISTKLKLVKIIPIVFLVLFSSQFLLQVLFTRITSAENYGPLIMAGGIFRIISYVVVIFITLWGIKKQWLYKTAKA